MLHEDQRPAVRMLGRLVRGLVLVLLVAAPLPFGSVRPFAVAAIQVAVAAALALWGARIALGADPALPASRLALAAALLLLLVGLQLLPLGETAVARLSPGTAAVYDDLRARGGEALAGVSFSRTLSLTPSSTADGLRRLAAALAVLVVVASAFRGRRRLAVLAGALALLGSFEAIYGLLESLSGRQQIFGYVKRYYTDAATGTYINKNHFAGLLEMCLPATLGLYLSRRGAGEGASSWREALGRLSSRRASVNLFLALALAAMLAGLGLSLSRSGILFGLLGTAVVALGVAGRQRAWRGVFAGAAVVAAGGGFVVLAALETVTSKFASATEDAVASGSRLTVWGDALRSVGEFPLFGAGLGSFAEVFPRYRSPEVGFFFDHAHNEVVQAVVETGIVGTVLLLVALAAAVARGRALLREERGGAFALRLGFLAAALALGLHSLTDFNLRIPANALLFAACLGAALSAPREARGPRAAVPVIPFPEKAAGGGRR